MILEKLRELCDAESFKPFVLHLPDGRQIAVEHPDFVSFGQGGRILSVVNGDESESIIDLMLVSDITVKPQLGASY